MTSEERLKQFDAMGVPRKYVEGMQSHDFAQQWCSEEMVSADTAWAENFHAIPFHPVEFITGKKAYTLREVFAFCKGKEYADC